MINPRQRNVIRQRVHTRIREKMSGTAERPRLNVYRSLNHIYTQLIDDHNGVTLVSASSFEIYSFFTSTESRDQIFCLFSRSASAAL